MIESSNVQIAIPSIPKRVVELLTSVLLLNLFFLAGTWFWLAYYRGLPNPDWATLPAYKYFGIQVNLGNENVLASWYSSMLLLVLAAMAVICCFADLKHAVSRRDRWLSFGWLGVAAGFLFLSFDEMGSFHERIGIIDSLEAAGGYSELWDTGVKLGVGIIAAVIALWGWIVARRYPYVLKLMILAVLLLLSVDIFERIEPIIWHPAPGQSELNKPLTFTLFEEGSELFSWLCFMAALGVYTIFAIREPGDRSSIQRDFSFILPVKVLLKMAVIGMVIIGLSMGLVHLIALSEITGDAGIPENWFPSALAAIACVTCFYLYQQINAKDLGKQLVYLSVSLFCFFMSAYYGAAIPSWRADIWAFSPFIGLCLDGSLSVSAGLLAFFLVGQTQDKWSKLGAIAWAILLSLALFGMGRFFKAGLLDLAAFAVLIPALVFHLPRQQESSQATSPPEDDFMHLPSET